MISIVIPTYESNGKGVILLSELLESIYKQTYKDYEVIISDHSIDDDIKNYIENWFGKMSISYHRNESKKGNSSCNMNNGIKFASGHFIKIMHMDDKFCDENALQIINDAITNSEKEVYWGAVGFNHFFELENKIDKFMVPNIIFNPTIGESSMNGCPSVSFFKNHMDTYFDENLIIINDFDLYYRLLKEYSNPLIISDTLVTVRMHSNQVTNLLDDYTIKEKNEINYFKNKIK
jgi:glycosyltransferase involved in cell wall biosynthesis